jgi:AAA family ATP:ADP antiporter
VIPFYGWIGTKVNRFALVAGSLVFFAVNLVLFFISGSAGAHLGVIFYIWVGIFSVFVISQFWAFANDIYTESQGRRLFAFIGVGSSLGALWGSLAATGMVKWMALTPYQLMATAAGLLMVSLGFVWVVSRHEKRTAKPESAALADQKLGKDGGFQLIFRDRYLLWIAVLMVLLNIVNTGGEYIMGKLVEEASIAKYGHEEASLMVREQFIGGFYGSFYSWMNFLGFALQAGAVSRVMKVIGVRGSLFVLPFISLASYSSLAAIPLLGVARIAKIFENSTDYSLQNTVKQALWLPTSREAKYKAKAAVDTFFMRFGDVLAAGVVAAGSALGAGIRAFSGFNVLLCGVWIWVAWQIKNEHKKRVA